LQNNQKNVTGHRVTVTTLFYGITIGSPILDIIGNPVHDK